MSLVIETRLLNMLLLHNETCQLQWGTTPLMRDWRDENNKFDLDSKRRQTVDSLKHQFNREGK